MSDACSYLFINELVEKIVLADSRQISRVHECVQFVNYQKYSCKCNSPGPAGYFIDLLVVHIFEKGFRNPESSVILYLRLKCESPPLHHCVGDKCLSLLKWNFLKLPQRRHIEACSNMPSQKI